MGIWDRIDFGNGGQHVQRETIMPSVLSRRGTLDDVRRRAANREKWGGFIEEGKGVQGENLMVWKT